jgi:2-dehydro-3-deoxy-D-arabinonate dehydratase
MRFVSVWSDRGARLGLVDQGDVLDLSPIAATFPDLCVQAARHGRTVAEFVADQLPPLAGHLHRWAYAALDTSQGRCLAIPLRPPEVWACGVTYTRSRAAREFETGIKGLYDRVYAAARPEIFFKATGDRCVGPNEAIGVRGDSAWRVPEPELAFVLGPNQQVVGFTAGNDVSSRDIEGENPLYLPQAKIYRKCCALGPAIVTVDEVGPEPQLQIECTIVRSGDRVFHGATTTAAMKRSIEELRSYLCRYNPVPPGTVCLTGTGIVPPDDFTLEAGDLVEIRIDAIGVLRNRVEVLR